MLAGGKKAWRRKKSELVFEEHTEISGKGGSEKQQQLRTRQERHHAAIQLNLTLWIRTKNPGRTFGGLLKCNDLKGEVSTGARPACTRCPSHGRSCAFHRINAPNISVLELGHFQDLSPLSVSDNRAPAVPPASAAAAAPKTERGGGGGGGGGERAGLNWSPPPPPPPQRSWPS